MTREQMATENVFISEQNIVCELDMNNIPKITLNVTRTHQVDKWI